MGTVGSTLVGSMPAKGDIDTTSYSGRIAARLRELREAKGWTVADLQERINTQLPKEKRVAQSTVHGWDNGSRKIDPDFYPVLAKVFRRTIATLLPTD